MALKKAIILCMFATVCYAAIGRVDWKQRRQDDGQIYHIITQRIPTSSKIETTTPPQGGSETPPQGGNNTLAPQQGSSETPPQQGSSETPPPQGSSEAPPLQAGSETPPPPPPPPQGGSETPPQGGNNTLAPQGSSETPPPQGSSEAPPPQAGSETPPPQQGGIEKPSPPPPQECNSDQQTETQDGGNDQSPLKSGGSKPSPPQETSVKKTEEVIPQPQGGSDTPPLSPDTVNKFRQSLRVFSAVMYSKIIQKSDPEENIFFSPTSISHALGMLSTGAEGHTFTQIKEGLRMKANMDKSSIDTLFELVTKEISSPEKKSDVKVIMAARSFFQIKSNIKQQYKSNLQKFYHSDSELLDFGNSVQAAETINTWVEDQTNNLIKDLIEPSLLDPLTRFVLVNALYFKASWANGFSIWYTPMDFHTPTGNVSVPFLYSKALMKRLSTAKFEYIGIPYEDDSTYYFIIMPKTDEAMKEFEKEKDLKDFFKTLKFKIRTWNTEKITLYMPGFTTEMSLDVKKILPSMGVTDVFSSTDADLSGISKTFLYVSEFLHKARITVNKHGTEAAAATAVMGVARTIERLDEVTIDRPFIFGVQDKQGNILFMGKMVNPSKK